MVYQQPWQNRQKLFFFGASIFFISAIFLPLSIAQHNGPFSKNAAVRITPDVSVAILPSIIPVNANDSLSLINISSAKAASPDVGKPGRLIIPSININARIEHIGLTAEGAVGAPEGAFDVSWFNPGARPGEKGSAVISGHSGRWKDGTVSVFDPLDTVKPGAMIYVKDDTGQTISFVVKEMRIYGKDEIVPEIFNQSDKAYLNIITCHGDWIESEKTYSQRLVVFTQMQ